MSATSPSEQHLIRIAEAIEAARGIGMEKPYRLFDYAHRGNDEPHEVRDFRPGSSPDHECVFKSKSLSEAKAMLDRLTKIHIGLAAYETVMGGEG